MTKFFAIIGLLICFSCSNNSESKVKSPIGSIYRSEETLTDGFKADSLDFASKPRNVLLTKHPNLRLTPVYKVSYHPRTNQPFTGTTAFHPSARDVDQDTGNNWNENFLPGLAAAYGFNWVNVSHFNQQTGKAHLFFSEPVLINTLYFPAYSNDTLQGMPVRRDYYLASVYDEDTNQDGCINRLDLRRLYHFDLDAERQTLLIPKAYSVRSSEYDPVNDLLFVFAQIDDNNNGQMEYEEAISVFWIDLKNPINRGIQYPND